MQDPLALAERIVTLRAELARAEGEFRELVGGAKPRASAAPKLATTGSPAPTALRVRNLLKDNGKPLSFGEIRDVLGNVKPEAIKSALKKARDAGTVGFRGFKYYWK